jgi:digeranylgeranylglycerophospholipid reductase
MEKIDMFGKSKTGNRGNRGFFIKDDKIILGIRNLRNVDYNGKVYDIESAGTFCPFFLVHNCWIFPKGNKTANVGVGVVPGSQLPQKYLDSFIKGSKELDKASIIEVNAGGVPVGGLLKEMAGNGIIVYGEAAHHVNPIHGGGIKEAIISGQVAAEVAIKALKKKDMSKRTLSEFNSQWWKLRGNHLSKVEKIREIMENLTDDDFNMLADTFKPEDIVDFTRGAKLPVFAKALMKNPRLVTLARHLI